MNNYRNYRTMFLSELVEVSAGEYKDFLSGLLTALPILEHFPITFYDYVHKDEGFLKLSCQERNTDLAIHQSLRNFDKHYIHSLSLEIQKGFLKSVLEPAISSKSITDFQAVNPTKEKSFLVFNYPDRHKFSGNPHVEEYLKARGVSLLSQPGIQKSYYLQDDLEIEACYPKYSKCGLTTEVSWIIKISLDKGFESC